MANTTTHVRQPSPAVEAALEAARRKNAIFKAREDRARTVRPVGQRERVLHSLRVH